MTFASHPERQFMQYLQGAGWVKAGSLPPSTDSWKVLYTRAGSSNKNKVRKMRSSYG
jgi:hypothetical protein